MYIVAENHAFTSKRGMLKGGDEVTEKDFATPEAFKKAIAKGKVIEGKSKDALAAKAKKDKAEKAVQDAKDALAAAEKGLVAVNATRADAEAKITPAREALVAKEKENGDIAAARKAMTDAQAEYQKAKKPEDQSAAMDKFGRAEAAYYEKCAAVPEIKALADGLKAAEDGLAKAEKEKADAEAKITAAKETVTAAENELKAASAGLAALEGK